MDPIPGRSSTRWNPTREQLSQLESWFNQGIRTPTPAQINYIARRLLAYGPIKGKNVFYWFQNRKGRERRQKRKMERQQMSANTHNNNNSLNNKNNIVSNNNLNNNNNAENVAVSGYFNRFYRPSPSISPALSLTTGRPHSLFQTTPFSVGNLPYYAAQPRFGFYPHCPRTDLPSHLMSHNSPMLFHTHNVISFEGHSNEINAEVNDALFGEGSRSRITPATLDLFPVHPTGILQERDDGGRSDGDSNLVIIDD